MARGVNKADSPAVANLLAPLDNYLRRRQAIYEFSTNPACIFRLQELRLNTTIALSNGACFKQGEHVLDLHLWNEHIPRLEVNPLRWALRISECLHISLSELAGYLRQRPDLTDVVAVRANMAFGTAQQTAQLVRVSRRFGFEPVTLAENAGFRGRVHRFGENILIAFLVLAWNRSALRLDILRRSRVQAYLPRTVLDQRYGRTGLSRSPPPKSTGLAGA